MERVELTLAKDRKAEVERNVFMIETDSGNPECDMSVDYKAAACRDDAVKKRMKSSNCLRDGH